MGDFFNKAKLVHNGKYDYSKVNYINNRTKVCIICPEHGEFWQTPSNHLYGHGCPKCKNEKIGNKRRLTLEEFIEKARKVHGDKYDYSKVEYVNNSTKVCIICPQHGEFWQAPQNHLKGNGCPKCVNLGKKGTTTFIEEAKKVHGDKYDYSKVEYINSKTKVCIICSEHGEFWQIPYSHLQGKICPKCGVIKSHLNKNKATEEFIKEATKVHDNKYNYSKVDYKNSKTKICITCPEHGEFWQTPKNHLRGCGCPKCKAKLTSLTHRLLQKEFIQKCYIIYGNKYDYSKVKYINTYEPITIICPKHGEFIKKPVNFLKGLGCPQCGKEHYHDIRTNTKQYFIEKANSVHSCKYDYSKVNYINNKTKVCIICPEHGEFWQNPDKHLIGQGCPKCSISTSNSETNICQYLKANTDLNIVERSKNIIHPYELDIYVPEKKIGIEYNGLIWHSEKFGKDKNYHLNKTIRCEKQGICLIHIFEDEWLEHENIIKSKLKYILGDEKDLSKVFANECNIKPINHRIAKDFLIKNDIQGYYKSTIHLGCYYKDELVGVMCFKKGVKSPNRWKLTRFATDINKQCISVEEILFKYFVNKYDPTEIYCFADRRWVSKDNNVFVALDFKLTDTLRPDYCYTNGHTGRISKLNFRKKVLLKKYPNGCSLNKNEIVQKLGFYKIWDCGLYKYVWHKDIYN